SRRPSPARGGVVSIHASASNPAATFSNSTAAVRKAAVSRWRFVPSVEATVRSPQAADASGAAPPGLPPARAAWFRQRWPPGRGAAGQHLVQDGPQRVHVGGGPDLVGRGADLLGWHVTGRAQGARSSAGPRPGGDSRASPRAGATLH